VTFRRASGSGRSASPATGTRSRGASALGGCQAHVPHSQPHAAPFLPQRPRPICRRYPASTRPSVRRSARGQARAAVPPDPLRVVYGHSLTLHGSTIPFAPEREALPEDIALAYAKVLRTPVYKALPFEQRWSVWGAGYGGYNKTSGDPVVVGSHDLTARTAGGAAGLDYRIAPGTVVGFALAGGGTGWSLAQNLGSGRSDAFQAGIYGTTRYGPAYLAAALAYTEHWMSTDRYAFAGDYLTANFNAHSFGGRAEAGYRVPVALWALTPYAAVQAQNFHTPTYSETDVTGGGFGLTYNARNATDTRSELGARFDKQILLNWSAVLALRGKVAWAHDWVSNRPIARSGV
jgi:uncharacterized protein YhjY with autotransporter beta-barrel domain